MSLYKSKWYDKIDTMSDDDYKKYRQKILMSCRLRTGFGLIFFLLGVVGFFLGCIYLW